MATKAANDPAVFDQGLLTVVQRLIPPERLHAYLRDLEGQLVTVLDCSDDDSTLGSRAHMIVSQAGMLGLTRLSEYARELEDACRAGAAPQAALVQLRAAAGDIRHYAMPAAGIAAG
jgi:HPt (histidine-containing phosphotransfer) domain-containing protein